MKSLVFGLGLSLMTIGPLHKPVTWHGLNYAVLQVTQWDFENKGTRTSPARLFFVLKVALCNLRPSIIYPVPCDRLVQWAHSSLFGFHCTTIKTMTSSKTPSLIILTTTSSSQPNTFTKRYTTQIQKLV